MSPFLIAMRAELFVALRQRRLWLLLLLPTVAAIIRLLLIRINVASANLQQSLSGRTPSENVDFAYGYLVDGLLTGLVFIYILFMAMAAFSFSSDRDQGTVRHLIIRQSSRLQVLAAKALVLHGQAIIACICLFVITFLLSAIFWDFGPVIEDGYELISVAEIHDELRTGIILALLPLPACLCLGVFFSVVTNSALQAVSVAVGISLLLDIFKGALGSKANFLYLNFQPSLLDNSYLHEVSRIVRGFSDVLIDEQVMQFNYWLPIPQAIIFLIVALVLVRRKNL